MRRLLTVLFLVFLLLVIAGLGAHMYMVHSLAPTESYPTDTWLDEVQTKRALVIVAHDDDVMAMTGTMAYLKAKGWQVRHLTFRADDPARVARFEALAQQVATEVAFIPFGQQTYRRDLDTLQRPWWPIPVEKFPSVFDLDTVYQALHSQIETYRPSVLFTLDDSIGGYGHPEHVMISRLVHRYCREQAARGQQAPPRLYQSVYSPHMEAKILRWHFNLWNFQNPFEAACRIYEAPNGMPAPTTQINIRAFASAKKDYYLSYGPREQRSLRKFAPYYAQYPAWIYFSWFDREFFRVLAWD